MRPNVPLAELVLVLLLSLLLLTTGLSGQTDCEKGNGPLDSAPPKTMSAQDVIQKFGATEAAAKEARLHYTYTQDVLVQTLSGQDVTGAFHEVTNVSYDEKGRRQEKVTFAAQSTLRGVQLTQEDMEDIRVFMPLMLTERGPDPVQPDLYRAAARGRPGYIRVSRGAEEQGKEQAIF